MIANQEFINLRRSFRSRAHAQAMQGIAAALNGRRPVVGVQNINPPAGLPVDVAAETAAAREKLLSQSQQQALEGIAMLLREIDAAAKQINIQAAAFGLPLPKLVLSEVSLYTGQMYRVAADAVVAASKLDASVELDTLRRARELKRLRVLVGAE